MLASPCAQSQHRGKNRIPLPCTNRFLQLRPSLHDKSGQFWLCSLQNGARRRPNFVNMFSLILDAISLLSACFECVLIDVDAHPDITNELHIQHVPSGCILDTNGKVITRFECPSSTALFIATVARQLPQTSTGAQIAGQSSSLENAISVTATTPEISADFSTAGTLLADGAATGPTTASESVSGIAAKVRGLSSFAMTESSLPETVIKKPSIKPSHKTK